MSLRYTAMTTARVVIDMTAQSTTPKISGALTPQITWNGFSLEAMFNFYAGHYMRTRILFQMKRYDEALVYANKALSVNDRIEDRSSVIADGKWNLSYESDNNYMLIHCDASSNLGDMYSVVLTSETVALFDDGDFVKDGIYNPQEGWSDIYNMYVSIHTQCFYTHTHTHMMYLHRHDVSTQT